MTDKTIVTKKYGSKSKILTCEFGEAVFTVPKGLGPTLNLLNITMPKGPKEAKGPKGPNPNLMMNIVIPRGPNVRKKAGSKMVQVTMEKAQEKGELKGRAEEM